MRMCTFTSKIVMACREETAVFPQNCAEMLVKLIRFYDEYYLHQFTSFVYKLHCNYSENDLEVKMEGIK